MQCGEYYISANLNNYFGLLATHSFSNSSFNYPILAIHGHSKMFLSGLSGLHFDERLPHDLTLDSDRTKIGKLFHSNRSKDVNINLIANMFKRK